jgi:hypothetical protein
MVNSELNESTMAIRNMSCNTKGHRATILREEVMHGKSRTFENIGKQGVLNVYYIT